MPQWQKETVTLETELMALSWIKRHARIYADDDDAYLNEFLVPAAIATVQRDTQWVVNPVKLTATFTASTREIRLPHGPYASARVFAIGLEDAETEIEEGIGHDGGMPGVLLLPAIATPHTSLRVEVTIGPLDPDPAIKILVATLVAHWFEHPEAVTADGDANEVPLGYKHLVASMRPMVDAYRIAGGV